MSISTIIQNYLMGMYRNNPAMQQFNSMMARKTPEQQAQTLLNFAKSNGIDPNKKIFSEQDIKMLGIK